MSRPITPADGVAEPAGEQPHRASVAPDERSGVTPPLRSDHQAPGVVSNPDSPPDVQDPAPAGPHYVGSDRRQVLVRQRARFGGVKVGSAFFGWLTATGLAAILGVVFFAVGLATSQSGAASPTDTAQAWTVGPVGGVVLLAILFLAYLAGGYVAGRMARFNGARQGIAVWLWGAVITGLLAAVDAIAGWQYDLSAQFNLPRIRMGDLNPTPQTLIVIAIVAAVALAGAVLGGLAGMRFHRRVDRAGEVLTPIGGETLHG